MNTNNYTSLELSKKLKESGCELPASQWWRNENSFWNIGQIVTHIPAYDILNDICVKYATSFFGDKEHCSITGEPCELNPVFLADCICHREATYTPCEDYPKKILSLLQKNKKDKAEKYIWEKCRFNPENKQHN